MTPSKTSPRRLVLGFCIFACAVAQVACGNDGGSTTTSLVVRVETLDGVAGWLGSSPAENAIVSISFSGDEPVEQLTDEQGHVEFAAIDWTRGPVFVSAYLPDYTIQTEVLVESPPEHELELAVTPLEPRWPDLVTVTGSVVNLVPGDYVLAVSADTQGALGYQGDSNRWSIQVPPGLPFNLIAYEVRFEGIGDREFDQSHVRYAILAHEAVESDTSDVVIDFDEHAARPRSVSGSFAIPTRPDSPVFQGGWGYIRSHPGGVPLGYPIGLATKIRFDADQNRYEYDVDVWDEAGSGPAKFILFVREGCCGTWASFDGARPWHSFLIGTRDPEGDQGRVLDIPEWRVDRSCDGRHSLKAPLSWETWEDEAWPVINLYSGSNIDSSPLVWQIYVAPTLSSITLPPPPGGLSAEELLGPIPMAELAAWQDRPEQDGRAVSYSDRLLLLTHSCE